MLLFLGLTDLFETEGYDRAHMRLPFNQLHLLDRLAGAGKRRGGGAGGRQPRGNAVAAQGEGRAGTPRWAARAWAKPCSAFWTGRAVPGGAWRRRGPKGWRTRPPRATGPWGRTPLPTTKAFMWATAITTKRMWTCAFPFGYGLSYTSFAYSGLTLSRKVLAPGKAIEVLFTVENTGAMAGVETAQVYVAHRNSAAHQPVRTLAGFARVALKPGERKTVCVTLPPSALEFWRCGAPCVRGGGGPL